jgi:hypothetical protein
VVVEEWTDPADLGKPLFFWNLNGVVTAPANVSLATPQRLVRKVLGTWWIPFQLFVIFWDLDNWPVFMRLETENADALGRVGISIRRWGEYLMTIVVLEGVSSQRCLIRRLSMTFSGSLCTGLEPQHMLCCCSCS